MVRNKSLPRSKHGLYPEGRRLTSGSSSTLSSSNSRLEKTSLDTSESRRKSTPHKKSVKSRTKVFVQRQTVIVRRLGKQEVFYRKTFGDIKYLQQTVHNLIPKLPFSRLVREILQDVAMGTSVSHVTSTCLAAIQESSELYLVCLFSDCNAVAIHAKRKTIKASDMALVLTLRQHS